MPGAVPGHIACIHYRRFVMSTPTGKVQTSSTITQAQLARFHNLKILVKEYNQLRMKLIAGIDAKAHIEPGEFTVRYNVCQQRRLTAEELIAHLGLTPEQVQAIRQSLAPR